MTYRRAFPTTEIALPALALRHRVVAKWVREEGVAVDVRSGEELGVAIAAGIHPTRMTVHVDTLSANEILFCTANLGVSRVVVSSTDQIELLTVARHRRLGVLIRMTDVNAPLASAVMAVLHRGWARLIGLHCDIGTQEQDFVSYPAAIGHMIAEMTHIRQDHHILLTRLSLGGERGIAAGDWAIQLAELATEIDETLDDACATMRFPRPTVVLSMGHAAAGQRAA